MVLYYEGGKLMSRLKMLKKQMKERLDNKRPIQTLKKPLSYEEVIRRYEELLAR